MIKINNVNTMSSGFTRVLETIKLVQSALTVGELIEVLQEHDKNLPVTFCYDNDGTWTVIRNVALSTLDLSEDFGLHYNESMDNVQSDNKEPVYTNVLTIKGY